MGVVLNFVDRLTNALSGKGTTVDRRVYNSYAFIPVAPEQAEAAYRSSWLFRKIIDIPPFDMTREGRDWQAESAAIEKIEAEEERLQLWFKLQRGLILARLYGGGGIVLGTGDGDPKEPLNPETVKIGGLKYAHVMSRYQLTEGGQQRLDPEDPWFGQPEFFTISGGRNQIEIHPSRVIAFVGQRAPEGSRLSTTSWFWGDPIMQSIRQAVENADLAQDGFADLINEAKVDILKTPKLTEIAATAQGEQRIANRVQAASVGKSNYRALLLDSEEEWEQKQITWDGMPDIIVTYLNAVAGAADIPLTRLLGVSPKGLQSTGDGEERDYQSMVRARQNEMLKPALARIDDLLIRSALGSRPSDVYYEFAPLRQMDEKDSAEIEKKAAETLKAYFDTGALPERALAKIAANRMVESGRWPGSEAAFEEAKKELEEGPDEDPAQLTTLEERVGAMEQRGTVTPQQATDLLTDAKPRTLYVQRKLLNAGALINWAKDQGFETTLPAGDMHVTVLFSRTVVDWMEMGEPWSQDEQGRLKVAPGGSRAIEQFGDLKKATVLLFNSSALAWRHEEMVRKGASHDFDEYAPHLTITYETPADLDLEKVEPYRGELIFGPEIFEEIDEDWQSDLTEE